MKPADVTKPAAVTERKCPLPLHVSIHASAFFGEVIGFFEL
jgi:hypothetical protein